MDYSRQLAKWESLIERTIRGIENKVHMKWSIGELGDRRQIARMAVMEVLKSPKFKEIRNKPEYLSRRIKSRLVDAARECAFIRIHYRNVDALLNWKPGEVRSREAEQARRAINVQVVEDMDNLGVPGDEAEPGPGSAKTFQDVEWAIGRLPGSIGNIMGHLFGVCGYDKLSQEDTAQRLGLKLSSVRRLAYEGRRLLRNLLKDCGYTERQDG